MMKIFDFNKTKAVIKDRDALLKEAALEGKTIAETIASDYAESFHMTEEDGLKLVEDMNACAAEYRMEVTKAETLLPEEYLQEKIDAIKADEAFTLYQKYCALAGIFETLTSVNRAAATKEAYELALEEAKQSVTLKPEEEVTEADLDELTDLIVSTGSICLLAVPEDLKKLVTDAIEGGKSEEAPEINKEDLALLDAYCIYKAIKSGRLVPEPEWKDADSLVLLRALVFRATAEQDVESIIKEVADGKMTWEKAEQLIQKISSVVLFVLTVAVLTFAAAGSIAAFLSLSSVVGIVSSLLLFGALLATLYALYRGFDYIDDWMTEVAAPAIARESVKAAKKVSAFAKECKEKYESRKDKTKAAPETTGEEADADAEVIQIEIHAGEETEESKAEPEQTEPSEPDFA